MQEKSIILTKEEVKKFCKITGIKAEHVVITKHKQYYYATIISSFATIRIGKDIADKFL